MKTTRPKTAAKHFTIWRDELLSGRKPIQYRLAGAGPLAQIDFGPGRVVLLGGPPGTGKTALVWQLVVDAVRLDDNLRAVICSVEMPPAALFDRQLARLSGIDATTIRRREFTLAHRDRIDAGLATLEAITSRLAFAGPPFDLATVADAADNLDASLLTLDYIQRIPIKSGPDDRSDRRGAVSATMDRLRLFADDGAAVLAVAAVGRSKDGQGRSSYANLSLASYRETSELEYGCDDAYLLVPDSDKAADSDAGDVLLRQEKSRYGERLTIPLRFDARHMRFIERPSDDLTAAVGNLWPSTAKGGA